MPKARLLILSIVATAVVVLMGALPREASASPILVAQAGAGVDLNNLAINQVFLINIRIFGGAAGELGPASGSGGGVLAGSFPNLNLETAVAGPDGLLLDLSTNPRLFALTFRALAIGAGTVGVTGSTLITNLATYAPLTSSLVGYTVRDQVAVPEPTSMLLLGSGLVGVIARARRRKRGSVA